MGRAVSLIVSVSSCLALLLPPKQSAFQNSSTLLDRGDTARSVFYEALHDLRFGFQPLASALQLDQLVQSPLSFEEEGSLYAQNGVWIPCSVDCSPSIALAFTSSCSSPSSSLCSLAKVPAPVNTRLVHGTNGLSFCDKVSVNQRHHALRTDSHYWPRMTAVLVSRSKSMATSGSFSPELGSHPEKPHYLKHE